MSLRIRTWNRYTLIRALTSLTLFILAAISLKVQAQEPAQKDQVPQLSEASFELLGLTAQASALESGQSDGLAMSYAHILNPKADHGAQLRLGTLLSYEVINENSLAWSVTHQQLRVGVEQETVLRLGRGSFGLSIGLAGLMILESQSRLQAGRLAQELESSELSLQRKASVLLPELSLAPTARLRMTEREWGDVGLSARLMLTYHPLSDGLPSAVSDFTWGALFGLYFTPSRTMPSQSGE